MKRAFIAAILLLLSTSVMAAGVEQVQLEADAARVFRSADGATLTPASAASHAEIAAGFLQMKGRSAEAVRGMVPVSVNRVEHTGVTHHRFEQRVEGLPVFGAYSKIAIDEQGRIINAIDRLVDVPDVVQPARIRQGSALRAAMKHIYGDERPLLYQAPAITKVAVPMPDGTLREGFLVETWTEKDNLLHHTLVGGDGEVLNVELRTALESYNIFPDHPNVTPQTIVSNPAGAGSPQGWLFASGQRNIDIAGNNARAYLDVDANNAPDSGGTSVTDGNFTTSANLSQEPSTSTNRAVAVQNLFYLNNLIHDKLYQHGFNEAAGNFQESNFGNGGFGSDSVNAEAQDGSGTDNANFATPTDGSNPRMQMYLWNGLGDHVAVVGSTTYLAMGAEFGPALNTTGVSAPVAYAGGDGCTSITSMLGKIALIDRGNCDFVTKVKNAQNANATGVIIANNAGNDIISMGGTDTTITIPSIFVGQDDGAAIKAAATTTKISANPNPPLMRDGDLDSDIVYHEYGHGLTWRMIGSMSGAMSGAIGEGMSDVVAILMNGRPTVGSYSASNGNGIRRAPYSTNPYPYSYGDFAGASVHNDGEIYAAAVWRVWENFQGAGVSKNTLWEYLIQGMNYTPAGPTMDQMRDGILTAASGSGHECLIWTGFAAQGIGEGAGVRVRGPNYTVTESFAVPSSCEGGSTNIAPSASFTSSANELTVSFTDTSSDSDGTIASRSWNFGDGSSSTATNPSHTYAVAGTYSVTLTVTDNDGASDSATNSVTVSTSTGNAAPSASFTSSVSDLTASFTDTSSDSDGTIVSRSWSFGDGGTSTATNPSHTYASGGTYSVTLTVTDDGGLSSSSSSSVTVTAPSTGINLTASGYKVKGTQHADLSWSGTTGTVTILRDGAQVGTSSGSTYTDNIGNKGGGSYTYQVCESGTCSNTVQVVF